jgi:hypothetical protein
MRVTFYHPDRQDAVCCALTSFQKTPYYTGPGETGDSNRYQLQRPAAAATGPVESFVSNAGSITENLQISTCPETVP